WGRWGPTSRFQEEQPTGSGSVAPEVVEEAGEGQRPAEQSEEDPGPSPIHPRVTEKLRQEKQTLEQSASELQRTISELGELIHEMKEKEQLLVFFPDLHIPVETRFEISGNVMEDMGKQLQANNIRISILEEENARLRNAIAKIKGPAQQETQKVGGSAQGTREGAIQRHQASPGPLVGRKQPPPGPGDPPEAGNRPVFGLPEGPFFILPKPPRSLCTSLTPKLGHMGTPGRGGAGGAGRDQPGAGFGSFLNWR
uniref:Uncharacterized protein n=1 Tax=Naja naja TaxID=35670 RepID=A0A8C6YCL8_NAJNA